MQSENNFISSPTAPFTYALFMLSRCPQFDEEAPLSIIAFTSIISHQRKSLSLYPSVPWAEDESWEVKVDGPVWHLLLNP